MEGIKDLRITNFIAHVVDHRTGSLDLSDLPTPVDAASRFPHDFFQSYILYALRSDLRRRARFRSPAGAVKTAFDHFLAGNQGFVDASKAIASHLYQVMSNSRYKATIKPGDIMVALFQEWIDGAAVPPIYQAILKIDPSDAVLREVVKGAGGQQVLFSRREDRVPEVEQSKIQKIAVLSPRLQAAPEPHDLVILDNNIDREGVARFFFEGFLEATLNRSSKEMTEVFLNGVKLFVSSRADVVSPPLLPDERLKIIDRAVALLQTKEAVTLEGFSARLAQASGRTDKDTERFRVALVEQLQRLLEKKLRLTEEKVEVTEEIAVDMDEASRQNATLKFLLDGGVSISGPKADVLDLVKIGPANAAGVFTLTIKTQTLVIR